MPDTHIAVMPATGGKVTQLTSEPGQSWPHSWSPDGDKIVFAGQRRGVWDIWWVSRSSGRVEKVTDHGGDLGVFVRSPAWSPLGDQIVYERRDTTGDIWLAHLR